MKRILQLLFLTGSTISASGQLPDTDIFLSRITRSEKGFEFSPPTNMTRRPGYDNQPAFTDDGNAFYFVSINKDTTQSDIYKCDLVKRTVNPFTRTSTSEYSPRITPDGKGVSVVRVDPDSGQRFYVIPIEMPKAAIHIDNSDSIGYYAWTSDSTIAMFILEGKSNSLQLLNIRSGERKRIAPSIGRCLKTDLKINNLYYTDKSDTNTTIIHRIDLKEMNDTSIIRCMKGSEDFEVLEDGSLLQGNEGRLYIAKPGSSEWELAADFSSVLKDFYRIVVDPTGRLLALVAYTGHKP
jgi:hypothetical protein